MNRLTRSSQIPRNARTLALHMAMEAAQRAEVGQRIRELRGGLPQPELARRLGVSLRAVQKWEGGESAPQWHNLVTLAKHFGVTQDFLLYGDHNDEPVRVTQLDRIEAELRIVRALLERLLGEATADVLADLERDPAHPEPQRAGADARRRPAA